MNKTVTITLNKLIFYIEEEAYQSLKEYLDSIKVRFESSGDAAEILADMESSIADKFSEKTSGVEKVITKADVAELIKVMGSVEDIESEAEPDSRQENKSGEKDEADKGGGNVFGNKKLYRDPDDTIIAGVCSGLAAYFGIDSVIVRLIFAVSIFFGGTGVLAYLILWLVMPEAKSSSQKIEMRGHPVTLKKIEENIREGIKKYDENDRGWVKKVISAPFRFLAVLFSGFKVVFKNLLRILGIVLGIAMLVFAVLAIFGVTFGAGVALFNVDSLAVNSDFPIKDVLNSVPYYPFISSVYLVASVPIVFLIFIALSLIKKKNVLRGLMGGLLLGIWMLAIIASSVIAINAYPVVARSVEEYDAFQKAQITERVLELKDFSEVGISGRLVAKISYGEEYRVVAKGRPRDLDRLQASVLEGRLGARQDWREGFCFFCYREPIQLEVTLPKLEKLIVSGASDATLNKFESEDLVLELSGASELRGEVKAKNLSLKLSGASDAELWGEAGNVSVQGSGASNLSALDLRADSVSLELSGSSDVRIGPSRILEVKLTGASWVGYSGEPEITSSTSGSSEIQSLEGRGRGHMPSASAVPADPVTP